jgi:hypothetical protein
MRFEDLQFGIGEVILRQLTNTIEQCRAALIVEVLAGQLPGPVTKSRHDLLEH